MEEAFGPQNLNCSRSIRSAKLGPGSNRMRAAREVSCTTSTCSTWRTSTWSATAATGRLSPSAMVTYSLAAEGRMAQRQPRGASQAAQAADLLPLKSPDLVRAIEAKETLVMAHY